MKISNITRKFAVNKDWRSYSLIEDKLYIFYLFQNFSQFKLLKEIDKVLKRNLQRFFKGNSANLSWIIVFDKATNLFILRTLDLDISHYIVLNHILSYLKKLFT